MVIDENKFTELTINEIKTKKIVDFLVELKVKNLTTKILFVLTKPNKQFWLATRNLKNVEVTVANCLNLDQLLKTNQIILSNTSLELINLTYGKSYA
jgi:ribosomal protein L4